MKMKKIAKEAMRQYRCHGVMVDIIPESTISTPTGKRYIFEVRLIPGTKKRKMFDCAPDIKATLHWSLFEPFEENSRIYLAVSLVGNGDNRLLNILMSPTFRQSSMHIPIALGYDMKCEPFLADLARMPHILYGGATSTGKSVGLQVLTLSAIWKNPAQKLNLIIFDIGANDLDMFSDIPHLSHPIVKDEETGVYVIGKLLEEMERRVKLDYDELRMLPAIVLVMDEFVTFIQNMPDKDLAKKLTADLTNLLRRGRHAKIHIVLGTQDPTKENLKIASGNITSRAAFHCLNHHDSQAIIGQAGAEDLEGKGSMLYVSMECSAPKRLQGAYISEEELEKAILLVKGSSHDLSKKFVIPEVDVSEMAEDDACAFVEAIVNDSNGKNEELARIIMWVLTQNEVSANRLSEQFRMGNRSYAVIDRLCEMGIVSEQFSKQPRSVLPTCIDDLAPEVSDLLTKYNYSDEMLSEAFNNKLLH